MMDIWEMVKSVYDQLSREPSKYSKTFQQPEPIFTLYIITHNTFIVLLLSKSKIEQKGKKSAKLASSIHVMAVVSFFKLKTRVITMIT